MIEEKTRLNPFITDIRVKTLDEGVIHQVKLTLKDGTEVSGIESDDYANAESSAYELAHEYAIKNGFYA